LTDRRTRKVFSAIALRVFHAGSRAQNPE
jgi:hypothetical protein